MQEYSNGIIVLKESLKVIGIHFKENKDKFGKYIGIFVSDTKKAIMDQIKNENLIGPKIPVNAIINSYKLICLIKYNDSKEKDRAFLLKLINYIG